MIGCDTPNLITQEMRNTSVLGQERNYRISLLAIIKVKGNRASKESHKILVYDKDKIWFPIFAPECIPRKKNIIGMINKNNTPFKRLNNTFAYMIRLSLRHKNKRYEWEKVLGYTSAQLKQHLEKRFTKGMTWHKFHKGEIHIDHVLPISKFNYGKQHCRRHREFFSEAF